MNTKSFRDDDDFKKILVDLYNKGDYTYPVSKAIMVYHQAPKGNGKA